MKTVNYILIFFSLVSFLIGLILNFYYSVLYCSRNNQWRYFSIPIFMVSKERMLPNERKGSRLILLFIGASLFCFLLLIFLKWARML